VGRRRPDPHPVRRGCRQIDARISDAGVALYVGHGNRDFLIGERLAQAAGARLLPEIVVLDLHGVRTLLCHGDQLCTDDVEYQAFRARMRDPEVQARLLRLPYFVRRLIAAWLRRKSRDTKALKPESIMDVAIRRWSRRSATRRRAHDPRPHASPCACTRMTSTARSASASCSPTGNRTDSYLEVSAAGAVARTISA
jgi:UDP-2,3-diacylglucosamine diphosphatase